MKHFIRISLLTVAAAVAAMPAIAAGGGASPGEASEIAALEPTKLVSASRDRVTIAGASIHLGDLFSNTGAKAGIVVENAPAPGAQAVFDVYRLAAIAQSYGLVWQARSWGEKVVIERSGQIVPEEQIVATLRAAVEKELAAEGRFEVDVVTRDFGLTLPVDMPAVINVEGLRIHRASGQFTATVTAPALPSPQRITLTGRVHRVIEVPTLTRRISAGDIIGREDVQWTSLRAERVGRNVVTDIDRLLGMTPTRTLVAGKSVLAGEVQAPRIVSKGSVVLMLLKTPHMVLTSKGTALEHGARGDTIKVMNTQSKTVIEGTVTSTGTIEVSVAAFSPLAIPQAASAAKTAGR